MARVPLLRADQVGWVTRLVYRFAGRRYGMVLEPLQAAAHHPGLMWVSMVHEGGYERAAKFLDPALRDLAVHRVATVLGCEWCVDFGTMLAIKQGLSVARLKELHRYESSNEFTADEKLALRYADAMTTAPADIDDGLAAALRERLGAKGLVELTYAIAIENMRARTNLALGITEQGYTSGDACVIPADHPARARPETGLPETGRRGRTRMGKAA